MHTVELEMLINTFMRTINSCSHSNRNIRTVIVFAGQGDTVCQLLPQSETHSVAEGSICSGTSSHHTDLEQGLPSLLRLRFRVDTACQFCFHSFLM